MSSAIRPTRREVLKMIIERYVKSMREEQRGYRSAVESLTRKVRTLTMEHIDKVLEESRKANVHVLTPLNDALRPHGVVVHDVIRPVGTNVYKHVLSASLSVELTAASVVPNGEIEKLDEEKALLSRKIDDLERAIRDYDASSLFSRMVDDLPEEAGPYLDALSKLISDRLPSAPESLFKKCVLIIKVDGVEVGRHETDTGSVGDLLKVVRSQYGDDASYERVIV